MIFQFLKKLLLFYGLHPDRFNLRWQSNLRKALQFIMVLITVPQLKEVVTKILTGSDVTHYALDIMYFAYNLTINIQFFVFIKNFDQITDLIRFIKAFLDDDSKAYAEKLEKLFLKFCKTSMTLTFLSYFFGILDLITSPSDLQLLSYNRYFAGVYTPVHLVLYALSVASLIGNDLAHMCMFITYFNLCVHVVSIYHKLHNDFLRIEDARSVDEKKFIIKSFVESHIKVMRHVSMLVNSFKWILSLDFFLLTFSMTLIFLLFANNGIIVEPLTFVPPLLLCCFQFCYPSQLVENQVSER